MEDTIGAIPLTIGAREPLHRLRTLAEVSDCILRGGGERLGGTREEWPGWARSAAAWQASNVDERHTGIGPMLCFGSATGEAYA